MAPRSWLPALAAAVAGLHAAAATTVRIYDASPTPVQLVTDPISKTDTVNVHLYILVDAGDATRVVQGGAFWRWLGSAEWRPAPAPLYDEHHVETLKAGTTTRGYNIAYSMPVSEVGTLGKEMEFKVWALASGDSNPTVAEASKPVVLVPLPVIGQDLLPPVPLAPPQNLRSLVAKTSPSEVQLQALDILLFNAVAFRSATVREDGVHAHLVINVYPPQYAAPPDYQLFADVASANSDGSQTWEEVGAPSRFEHTWDVVDGKIYSRYNLSWRLSGQAARAAEADVPEPLRLRVRAASWDGPRGELELPPVQIVSV